MLIAVINIAILQLKPVGVVYDFMKRLRRSSSIMVGMAEPAQNIPGEGRNGSFDSSGLLLTYTELKNHLIFKIAVYREEEAIAESQKAEILARADGSSRWSCGCYSASMIVPSKYSLTDTDN